MLTPLVLLSDIVLGSFVVEVPLVLSACSSMVDSWLLDMTLCDSSLGDAFDLSEQGVEVGRGSTTIDEGGEYKGLAVPLCSESLFVVVLAGVEDAGVEDSL